MLSLLVLSLLAALSAQAAPQAGTARITGRVIEEDGRTPVAGARVVLMPNMPRGGPSMMPRDTTTDGAGRFTFESLPAGSYRLDAQKPGFAWATTTGRAPVVDVAAGETRNGIDIGLQRGGAIAGRVTDQNGEPMVDVHVMATRRVTPQSGRGPSMFAAGGAGQGAQTNDLGEFRVFGLPAGEYFVVATPRQDFNGAAAPSRTTMAGSTYFPSTVDVGSAHPVTVTAGQTTQNIVIRLVEVAVFEIAGVVVDQSDRPVAGAVVTLMPDMSAAPRTQPMPMPMLMRPPGIIRSDSSGRFTIPNIVNGSYRLAAAIPIVEGTRTGAAAESGGSVSWSETARGGAVAGGVEGGVVVGAGGVVGGRGWGANGGESFRYSTAGAPHVTVTVADANVSDVRLIAVRSR